MRSDDKMFEYAEEGWIFAYMNLGWQYATGYQTHQDYKKAFGWYSKAAEQGYAKGQLKVGEMYEEGKGVPQDYARAHLFYTVAATNGSEEGTKSRDILVKKMTSFQIEEAQRLASEVTRWELCFPQGAYGPRSFGSK